MLETLLDVVAIDAITNEAIRNEHIIYPERDIDCKHALYIKVSQLICKNISTDAYSKLAKHNNKIEVALFDFNVTLHNILQRVNPTDILILNPAPTNSQTAGECNVNKLTYETLLKHSCESYIHAVDNVRMLDRFYVPVVIYFIRPALKDNHTQIGYILYDNGNTMLLINNNEYATTLSEVDYISYDTYIANNPSELLIIKTLSIYE